MDTQPADQVPPAQAGPTTSVPTTSANSTTAEAINPVAKTEAPAERELRQAPYGRCGDFGRDDPRHGCRTALTLQDHGGACQAWPDCCIP